MCTGGATVTTSAAARRDHVLFCNNCALQSVSHAPPRCCELASSGYGRRLRNATSGHLEDAMWAYQGNLRALASSCREPSPSPQSPQAPAKLSTETPRLLKDRLLHATTLAKCCPGNQALSRQVYPSSLYAVSLPHKAEESTRATVAVPLEIDIRPLCTRSWPQLTEETSPDPHHYLVNRSESNCNFTSAGLFCFVCDRFLAGQRQSPPDFRATVANQ
ncbi:hypothetical protein BU23DRAFT_99541 [Bimuria novae-zelandiae CBS 107.79]|uniref:Uncharacterized protein n=1 Tax=Bimuria novae-zelandiae CBS 107.79 TaxID=1447943 RepID=A0A6A5VQI7_9PLEO|nr:hypothetical protein BU23DRAFT_99541 [Bimuria novae-zelandiae CBS 107.79]